MNRMQEQYQKDVAPALFKSFNFKNVMQIPRIEKVVINIGLGEAMDDPKALEAAVSDLTQIAGQKPVMTVKVLLPSNCAKAVSLVRK
jgi:large subunit ribosomal protein L5